MTSTTKKLQYSSHDSVKELAADMTNRINHWNDNPKPFTWHKPADKILERLGRHRQQSNPPTNKQRTSVSGH